MATVNPWVRFKQLLPSGQRTVGEVLSISTATGTSLVELRGGIEIRVQGTDVAVGDKAFIVDGQITGTAPNLPQYDVEV